MSEDKSRAERSVRWQNRYLTPVLLLVGMITTGVLWTLAAIPWWLAVVLLLFIAGSLASVVSRNRTDA